MDIDVKVEEMRRMHQQSIVSSVTKFRKECSGILRSSRQQGATFRQSQAQPNRALLKPANLIN